MAEWIVRVVGILLAALSAYGWWFHFVIGPAHGAGAEIGTAAGALAVICFLIAWLRAARNQARVVRERHNSQPND